MALLRRRLDLPPDPIPIARALRGRPGLCWLWTASGDGPSFVACDPLATARSLDPEPGLPLDPAGAGAGVPRWVGLLPYEATRAIERRRGAAPDRRPEPDLCAPLWLRYGAVLRIDREVEIIGDDPSAVARLEALARRQRGPAPLQLTWRAPPEADARHEERIERALELIAAGELYQVNLARRFDLRLSGDSVELLAALAEHASAPYAAALELGELQVASLSPELFLSLDAAGVALTRPIKGSRPRGRTPAEDRALIAELDADPKERAELTMVIDIERNDLGRLAEPASVELCEPPAVHTLPSIHHRIAGVRGRLRSGVSRSDLLTVMLPSGSITGAPKVRAMEAIAELEPHRRGLYTGAIGYLGHDGGLTLAMAIRTVTSRGGLAHFFAGGGIVADSDPAREVDETRWKALGVLALAGKPP
ncbi:MAG TPA: anthranilate synthase component I family protein [Polyangiaceae bacterium]|nr:anthranilate synthase component I family protein [Polyangiaceae bacterium]